MARIKIVGLPSKSKLRKLGIGGVTDECEEGLVKDEFGNCVPDFNAQPAQQGFGTNTPSNVETDSPDYANMLPNFSKNVGQRAYKESMGMSTNPWKTTGNEGTASNPMTQPETYPNSTTSKTQSNFWGNTKNERNLNKLNTGLAVGSAAFNYFDQKKKQKDFDAWQRNSMLPDNYYAVNTNMNRGDYEINTGMFKPNLMGYKSKGTQANPYYAQRNFGRDGGTIPYAAEGMLVAGDTNVQQAFIPSPAPLNIPNFNAIAGAGNESSRRASVSSIPKVNVTLKGKDIATRTNNPGNLLYRPIFAKMFGAVDSGIKQQDGTGTFAAFPDVNAGLAAREAQMFGAVDGTFNTKIYKPNTTVDQALRKWSNNGYSGSLYPEIANKTLAEVTPEERQELLKRQIKAESGSMYKQLKQAGIFAREGGELSNNNSMKIRITGTPDENQEMATGGQPQYSGQTDYGLYVGQRNLYRAMPHNPYEDPTNTVSEEPQSANNPHVLEAEDGETILRPDDTHMKIEGKRHSEGGEKLTKKQAPEGSFIFSDTKKMKIKDEAVLKNFGKGGTKALTPADIAKQYDTNKYLAILQNPNADILQKQTAKKMIENYKRKLAELGLVQEGMKGFPQGIPDISKSLLSATQGLKMPKQEAEEGQEVQPDDEQQEPQMSMGRFGGLLRKFVDGGGSAENFIGPLLSDKLIPWHGDKFQNKANASKYSSRQWADKLAARGYTGNYDPLDVQKFIYSHPEGKTAVDELHDKYKGIVYGGPRENRYDAKLGYRWDTALDAIPEIGKQEDYDGVADGGDGDPGGDPTVSTTPETAKTQEQAGSCPDGYVWDSVYKKCIPSGSPVSSPMGNAPWTSQDRRNALNAAVDYSTLKKYHPYSATIQPVLPEFIPTDWRGYAASLQSGANAAADQMGAYMPGQSMASNLSFLAGQQAENLGKYISSADQWNAAGAAAKDSERANILNQFTQYNAAKRDENWKEENVYDDRYRAAERLARKGVVKAIDAGEDTASKIYNENLTQKYFKIDPYTQRVVFNNDQAKAAWEKETSGGYQDPAGEAERRVQMYNTIYDQARGNAEQKHQVALAAVDDLFGGKGSSTTSTYPNAPKKNSVKTTEPITNKYGGNAGYSYYNPFFQ